jgi:hypothetical protein
MIARAHALDARVNSSTRAAFRPLPVIAALGLVLALLLSAAAEPVAAAGTTSRKAVIQVGGQRFTVDVSLDASQARSVNGPIRVAVTLPAGTSGRVIWTGRGFNGHGWAVSLIPGTARDGAVDFAVTVPARSSRTWVEVGVAAASGYALSAPGRANTAIVLRTYV